MLIKKYIYRYMTYIPLRFLVLEVLPNPFVCLITVKVEVAATSYAFKTLLVKRSLRLHVFELTAIFF